MAAAPQHMVALSRANRIRVARARLKQQVACGERSVADVLYQAPEETDTMTVFDLLCVQYRWGEIRARELLTAARISEFKTVGALSDRQRNTLIGLLEREDS